MARQLLRKIAIEDGRTESQARSFAECCINILQSGCKYNKGVERHIKRLLRDRQEKVCCDIIEAINKPNRDFFRKKRRWTEPDSNSHDRNQLYYIDKTPYGRPPPQNRRKRRRRYKDKSGAYKMGRMESQRRRTYACPRTFSKQSKRKTDGSQEVK